MKKLLFSTLAAVAVMVLVNPTAFAAAQDGKAITITGEGKCTKCLLKQTAECANAIEVTKGTKTKVYYLVQNDVSKSFHEDLCKEARKVTATGTVKKVDGKLQFTASKIQLAK